MRAEKLSKNRQTGIYAEGWVSATDAARDHCRIEGSSETWDSCWANWCDVLRGMTGEWQYTLMHLAEERRKQGVILQVWATGTRGKEMLPGAIKSALKSIQEGQAGLGGKGACRVAITFADRPAITPVSERHQPATRPQDVNGAASTPRQDGPTPARGQLEGENVLAQGTNSKHNLDRGPDRLRSPHEFVQELFAESSPDGDRQLLGIARRLDRFRAAVRMELEKAIRQYVRNQNPSTREERQRSVELINGLVDRLGYCIEYQGQRCYFTLMVNESHRRGEIRLRLEGSNTDIDFSAHLSHFSDLRIIDIAAPLPAAGAAPAADLSACEKLTKSRQSERPLQPK
jgi:hypothetical protein